MANIALGSGPQFTIDDNWAVWETKINKSTQDYAENYKEMTGLVDQLNGRLQEHGLYQGHEKHQKRHVKRGKLLARDRIEMILDEDSPFLELMPLAGYGKQKVTSVIGIGLVSGVECIITANVPTIKGGSINETTGIKGARCSVISEENRLPLIMLVESAGADLREQEKVFHTFGGAFKTLTNKSRQGIPTIAVVFGSSTAGGAYTPGMSDYVVMVKDKAKVFLGGPPLVKMATGEVTDAESLGGAAMHSKISGVSDYLAEDEEHALIIAREIVASLNYKKKTALPTRHFKPEDPPVYPTEELLGVAMADTRKPYDIREVIARLVDGSRFSQFKENYGKTLITCWARIHGFLVGIIANNGVLFKESANKGAQFIQLCDRRGIPLLYLHNITGFMVGRKYEESGIIKAGAHMINAVSNATVPAISVIIGSSYGAGHYAMCGRAYKPRFLFTWPNARVAVMGSEQLVGVMSIIQEAAAKRAGIEINQEVAKQMQDTFKKKVDKTSTPYFYTANVLDDGIIDPRHTRDILGMCYSIIYSGTVEPGFNFGIHRL